MTASQHSMRKLEYAPFHVYLQFEDGELRKYGESELLDAPWLDVDEVQDDNPQYWCSCDASFDSEQAAIEHLEEAEEEALYQAVYKRMYQLCHDIRLVKYQMLMEESYGCTPPHLYVEQMGSRAVEWREGNLDAIAKRLIETAIESQADLPAEDFPDGSIDGHRRADELREIVAAA